MRDVRRNPESHKETAERLITGAEHHYLQLLEAREEGRQISDEEKLLGLRKAEVMTLMAQVHATLASIPSQT